VLKPETKVRARALQFLHAWELQGRPPVEELAARFGRLGRLAVPERERAEAMALAVSEQLDQLDDEIAAAAEKWRLSRIGTVERNILRLGLHELLETDVPPKVVIDEGIRLAQWFAGEKAPAFVNGILDALARRHGRL
jgi:N utilization substance protein B